MLPQLGTYCVPFTSVVEYTSVVSSKGDPLLHFVFWPGSSLSYDTVMKLTNPLIKFTCQSGRFDGNDKLGS